MPVQSQRLTTSQSLAQKQVITQKLIQSIRLMAMPLAELRETIHEEADKNPALEVVREAGEVDTPPISENTLPESLGETDLFADSSDPGYQPLPKGDPDSKRRFIEGALSRRKSLHDHLLDQLRLLRLPPSTARLAESIIWNLNSDGFHREPPELLASEADTHALKAALTIIPELEPIGCACSNWRESLIHQARIRGDAPGQFERFVRIALPRMETGKPNDVRAALKFSRDDWEDLNTYITVLNPFPGRLYAADSAQYIVPDLVVRNDEGEHVLILNDEILPVIRLNPEFESVKTETAAGRDAKKFIAEHSREARYFINSLAQRDNTLLKVAHSVVEFQRDFFFRGPRALKPLTLKDVAAEIGVHEATVSRITTNKYVQTDWGLFELKYFFTNSISGAGSSGSRVSKVAAKEVIREIITESGAEKRISDQKVCDLLARRGINLARRTVAKYRKELDLPSSYHR